MADQEQETRNRAIAAATAVALALRAQNAKAPRSSAPPSIWRSYGRREQLLTRTSGNAGWR